MFGAALSRIDVLLEGTASDNLHHDNQCLAATRERTWPDKAPQT